MLIKRKVYAGQDKYENTIYSVELLEVNRIEIEEEQMWNPSTQDDEQRWVWNSYDQQEIGVFETYQQALIYLDILFKEGKVDITHLDI